MSTTSTSPIVHACCKSLLVAGSSYWNLGVGHKEVKVEDDEEGLRTMRTLGENMAWLLEKTAG